MNNDKSFSSGKLYYSIPRPQNRITESREHSLFSKTLPASKSDEAKSLKELLDKQQAAIAKANSQPSLLELIEESKAKSASRARDRLIIDLELLLQKQQVLLQIDRLEFSTNKTTITIEEFLNILQTYGVYEILKPCLTQIKSVLRTAEGLINFKAFIACLRKAQAVPRFVIPKPRVLTPLTLPWKLPPLPPIYGTQTSKVDRWSEKEWEDYYFNESKKDDDKFEDDDEDDEEKK